jgi:hypothetical protein
MEPRKGSPTNVPSRMAIILPKQDLACPRATVARGLAMRMSPLAWLLVKGTVRSCRNRRMWSRRRVGRSRSWRAKAFFVFGSGSGCWSVRPGRRGRTGVGVTRVPLNGASAVAARTRAAWTKPSDRCAPCGSGAPSAVRSEGTCWWTSWWTASACAPGPYGVGGRRRLSQRAVRARRFRGVRGVQGEAPLQLGDPDVLLGDPVLKPRDRAGLLRTPAIFCDG